MTRDILRGYAGAAGLEKPRNLSTMAGRLRLRGVPRHRDTQVLLSELVAFFDNKLSADRFELRYFPSKPGKRAVLNGHVDVVVRDEGEREFVKSKHLRGNIRDKYIEVLE